MSCRKLILLFSLLAIALPSYAALDVYVSGSLKGQIRYTPEAQWEALKRLNVNAHIEGDSGNLKAITTFEGLGDDFTWQQITDNFPTFNFNLKRATLFTQAPLYFGGQPATVYFGDVPVSFSPLLAQMDDTVEIKNVIYNPMRKGVSLKNFKLPLGAQYLNADAFLVWERNNEEERMQKATGSGIKLNATLWGNDLEFITVKREDVKESGRNLEKTDLANLITLTRESADALLKLEYGIDTHTERRLDSNESASTEGHFHRAILKYAFEDGIEGSFEYAALSADFDPVYRDRIPRFDAEGKRIKWNPLDEMRYIFGLENSHLYHQRQVLLGLTAKEANTTLALNMDYRTLDGRGLSPDGTYKSAKLSWRMPGGKYLFDGQAKIQRITLFGLHQTISNDLGWQLKFGLSRPFFETANNQVSLDYRWYYEQINPQVFGSLHQVKLINKFKVLKGLSAFVGMKQGKALPNSSIEAGQPVYVLGLDYQAKQGIEIEFRWASRNYIESPERLYDYEGEEYIGYDNIFRIGVNTAF